MVLVPLGADQPLNAERCAALGAARVLDAVSLTPAQVRDAAYAALTDPGPRAAARRLRDELVALPDVTEAVAALHRLEASLRGAR
jgi:UDP:flavonoid glycosyltransferase YjiC (YdhE family)